jgi:hypothetical protein
VIELVYQLPSDNVLTGKLFILINLCLENLKQRIVNLIQMKDRGVLGALMLYQDDRDFEGFKARVIHKLLSPSGCRETAYVAY